MRLGRRFRKPHRRGSWDQPEAPPPTYRGNIGLTAGRRRIALALFVGAIVILSIVALAKTPYLSPARKGGITASMVIDFGSRAPAQFAGYAVTWNWSGTGWTYVLQLSNDSRYTFNNVSSAENTAWSLMLSCAQILNSTTGKNLTLVKVYYPEFGEFLITGIGGVQNTNTLFWQYTVDGQPAAYGVQLQKLNSGDIVVWKMLPQ